MQSYILEQLDARERTRLKLLSPIGVAQRILARHAATLERRSSALQSDTVGAAAAARADAQPQAALREIETRLAAHRSAMLRDVKAHLAPVDGALLQLGARSQRFIDKELSLTNAFNLLNANVVQKRFEEVVVQVENQNADWHAAQPTRDHRTPRRMLNGASISCPTGCWSVGPTSGRQ